MMAMGAQPLTLLAHTAVGAAPHHPAPPAPPTPRGTTGHRAPLTPTHPLVVGRAVVELSNGHRAAVPIPKAEPLRNLLKTLSIVIRDVDLQQETQLQEQGCGMPGRGQQLTALTSLFLGPSRDRLSLAKATITLLFSPAQ